ncbi:uncharacterized protein [Dysidea avara]|uniref:uncharacterized protein isoform X2 n=1 Tax=Dysidea avara TaxID=196820 RepID=UPI003317370A
MFPVKNKGEKCDGEVSVLTAVCCGDHMSTKSSETPDSCSSRNDNLDCEGNASNAVCGTSREIPDDEHNPVCNDSHVSVKSNVIPDYCPDNSNELGDGGGDYGIQANEEIDLGNVSDPCYNVSM